MNDLNNSISGGLLPLVELVFSRIVHLTKYCIIFLQKLLRIYRMHNEMAYMKRRKGVKKLKKNRLLMLFAMLALIFVIAGCGAETSTETDEQQDTTKEETKQTAEEDPNADERIIAATHAIMEMMDVLEIDLVGVPTSYKDFPERYEGVTEIGNPMWPDMEIVMSLKPTDLLTVSTLKEDLEEDFKKIDVPATYLDFKSVDSMLNEMETIGEKYHREEVAASFISDYQEKMANLEASVTSDEQPKVLILMGIPGSYIVGTEHSYIGDLVERAGGTNAVTDREEEYISANTEYLQQLEPDVILRAAHGAPAEVVKMFDKEFAENDIWKHFKAVKEDRVYDLEESLFGTTANLAAIEALEELIKLLHE